MHLSFTTNPLSPFGPVRSAPLKSCDHFQNYQNQSEGHLPLEKVCRSLLLNQGLVNIFFLGSRASILPEKQPETSESGTKETTNGTLAVPTSEESKPAARSAEDLFAAFDFGGLNRPPSQDISRPFDNIPNPRLSDAKSGSKRKNRKSIVPALPPTVDALGDSLTPFGDAFKSFVQEAQPPAAPAIHRHPSPSISVIPSLTSNTTLDDASFNTTLSPPDSRNLSASSAQTVREGETARASQLSPTPSSTRNKRSSVFRNMLGVVFLKEKANSKENASNVRERRSTADEQPKSPGPSTIVTPAFAEKNGSTSSLTRGIGSLRRLGRRSRDGPASPTTATAPTATSENNLAAAAAPGNGTVAEKDGDNVDELLPPAPVTADNGRNSPVSSKYSHGVVLHPVMEEDTEVAV